MAAAPRLLANSVLNKWRMLQPTLCNGTFKTTTTTSIRHSSYLSSPPVRPLEKYPEVEVVKNAPEWKFVERLLPPEIVPKPVAKPEYPSGWKPTKPVDPEKLKYYVARTKNHMVPVYLHTTHRGMRRLTVVRRVQGDIWELERELRAVIEKSRNGKLVASRVNEMSCQIHFHGDHVDVVREHLKANGF